MLQLKNNSYSIDGKKIIDDISYEFEQGNIYILTGPNGGGKTSLGKLITGLYRSDNGSIFYDDKDITALNISERANLGISYGFQSPIYFKGLSVRDLLQLSSKSYDEVELSHLLSQVGLCGKNYLDRDIDDRLSGGEIKRIEIASVLAKKDTKLYIFDEPEAGIDLWSFKELISIFKKLKEQKKTLIIISHQEKILELSDFILVISDGKITRSGPTDKIFNTLSISHIDKFNCEGCEKKELD
ncbi:MAG: ATP-binding cassette domain-containing protein [Sphaerochaetaceae bacterium]